MEGYSYSSTGKVFSIAEFVGLLKYKIEIIRGWNYVITPPSTAKKFILKGNSSKTALFTEFYNNQISDLVEINPTWSDEWYRFITDNKFGFKLNKIESPLGDVMDSLYLAMHKANEYANSL